jgi:hypothetical protein
VFTIDPGYADQLTRWGLDELAGVLAFPAQIGPPPRAPQWQRVAAGSTNACYRVEPDATEIACHFRTLYLKQYRYLPASHRYVGRASRAACEARNLRALASLGIHCPRVVALGERREGGPPMLVPALLGAAAAGGGLVALLLALLAWMFSLTGVAAAVAGFALWALAVGVGIVLAGVAVAALLTAAGRSCLSGAVLITTAIEPSEDLHRFAHGRWRPPADADESQWRQIDRISAQLATQVATLHRRRFVHKDLKFRNLLLCWPRGQQPAVDNLRIAWIDCPRGRWLWPGPWLSYGRISDLANLDRNAEPFTTRAQRLRFLRDYLFALGGAKGLKRVGLLARRITSHRLRRHHRLGRRARKFKPEQ